KLQQLEFDLQEIAFAQVADVESLFTDVHGLLEAVQILLRELQGRFRQQNINELLTDVEDKLSLTVGDLRAHHGGLILRGLKAVLALLAALEQVAQAGIELRLLVNVVRAELVGLEDRKKLGIEAKRGIGTKVRRDFFRQALLDG